MGAGRRRRRDRRHHGLRSREARRRRVVDLPTAGSSIASGKVVGEIESTKSVGELFAPVDGEIVEANQAVVDSPELVNSDPFGEGWLIKVRFASLPELLSFDEYSALVGE